MNNQSCAIDGQVPSKHMGLVIIGIRIKRNVAIPLDFFHSYQKQIYFKFMRNDSLKSDPHSPWCQGSIALPFAE